MAERAHPLQIALCLGVLALTSSVFAVNRFEVPDRTFNMSATGNEVPVLADLDQDVYGFSVSFDYDPSRITVTGITLGAHVAPLDPEFSAGEINGTTGEVMWGVVFALSAPRVDVHLNAGQDRELLVLGVDTRNQAGTTVIDLRNGSTPGRRNVITNVNGDSVSPAPSLDDGTITIRDLRPVISDFLDNSGGSGKSFLIVGTNFDQPGLRVRVCGSVAQHSLLNSTTIQAIAPSCADTGPAAVEVCNDFGCATDPDGFTYTSADAAPIITSAVQNSGTAGRVFFADGRNFEHPDLRVEVCGVDAEFTLLTGVGSLRTLQITAPECGATGWAVVRACNEFGCGELAEGFFYEEQQAGGLQRPGDCNQDGGLDVSDAVCLLGFLFLGNPVDLPCGNGRDNDPANMILVNFNGDGLTDLSDAVGVLRYLFQGGSPHAAGETCRAVVNCPNVCR